MKALCIAQPWAYLVVNGYKDIENRSWPTQYRGPLFILASKKEPMQEDMEYAKELCKQQGCELPATFDIGGIVGMVHLGDCVKTSESIWYQGDYGFVLSQARPVPFIHYKGQLKIFNIEGLDYLWDEIPPLAPKPPALKQPPVVRQQVGRFKKFRNQVSKVLNYKGETTQT